MRRKYAMVFTLTATVLLLAACSSSHETGYLINVAQYRNPEHPTPQKLKVAPYDKLYISVFSEGVNSVAPFNLLRPSNMMETTSVIGGNRQQDYLVEKDGSIYLPVLGRMVVQDMTVEEIEELIATELTKDYFHKKPVVTVRLDYYSFSILGEVLHPGVYYTDYDRVNIFEALGIAGDLTIYGLRNKVKVVRENEDGTRSIGVIDLQDAEVMNSPYFYIQQNDVVYVEPNRTKARNADVGSASGLWIRAGSIGVSLAALLVAIFLK